MKAFILLTFIFVGFVHLFGDSKKDSTEIPDPDALQVFDNNVDPDMSLLSSIIRYPESARRAGIEGSVYVMVLVGKNGVVEKTEVIKSTNDIFIESSLKAIYEAEPYTIAYQKGKPVQYWITIPLRYQLEYDGDKYDFTEKAYKRYGLEKPYYEDLIESIDYGNLKDEIFVLGYTEVEVVINENGKLESSTLVHDFDKRVSKIVMEAIKKYEFPVYMDEGEPRLIKTRIHFPF